jgi:hypothetical protein
MLALSGLLNVPAASANAKSVTGNRMCWSFLVYLLAGVAAVASFGYLGWTDFAKS